MKLLIIHFRNIANRSLDAGKQILSLGIVEDVRLQDRHIDAAQELQVDNILQRSCSDHRQKPPRRAVIDEPGKILGDAHRDTGAAADLKLNDTTVDRDIRRWDGGFGKRWRRGKTEECKNGRGRDDPALHDKPSLSGSTDFGKVWAVQMLQ
jgi:hypothetical protein